MATRVLLVEGKNDVHVLKNLIALKLSTMPFEVKKPENPRKENDDDYGGFDPLLKTIRPTLNQSGMERLAVVVDADKKESRSRWQAICHRLNKDAKYEVKPILKKYDPNGTVVELPAVHGRKPIRFGAWVMPNNQSEGMLENFFRDLIIPDDTMLPYVKEFINSIPEAERRFKSAHLMKACIHTWLSVSEDPGKPMGQAIIRRRHLNLDHPLANSFLNWVQRALVND